MTRPIPAPSPFASAAALGSFATVEDSDTDSPSLASRDSYPTPRPSPPPRVTSQPSASANAAQALEILAPSPHDRTRARGVSSHALLEDKSPRGPMLAGLEDVHSPWQPVLPEVAPAAQVGPSGGSDATQVDTNMCITIVMKLQGHADILSQMLQGAAKATGMTGALAFNAEDV